MKPIYLSKVEQLAEWFMLLFFDPMYFYVQANEQEEESISVEYICERLESSIVQTKERIIEVHQYFLETVVSQSRQLLEQGTQLRKVFVEIGKSVLKNTTQLILVREKLKKSTLNQTDKVLNIVLSDYLVFK